MNKEEYNRLMNYNVSSIFTFLLKNKGLYLKVKDYFKDSYSYNVDDFDSSGKFKEDYLYFRFVNQGKCDELLEELHYIEKRYIGDYIIVKVDKWMYMSRDEWELLKLSNYYDFKDLILQNSKQLNKGNNLQNFIINRIPILAKEISEYIGCDITEDNIFWKAFSFENEILDLSKISDMTILGYKKSWIDEKMKKANYIEMEIYQDVLNNSFEITTPNIISLGQKPKIEIETDELLKMYNRLQSKLIEYCGKKQHNLIIKGAKYPLFPNSTDFIEKLTKTINKYKLDNLSKIEKCLDNHLKCLKEPQLKYYIGKNNESRLADDYETIDEFIEKKQEIIETKNMF